MDDSAEFARNALQKRKDKTRRKVVAKEFCDGTLSREPSLGYEAQEGEERRKTSASQNGRRPSRSSSRQRVKSKIENVTPPLVETCTRFYVHGYESLECERACVLYHVTRPKNIVQSND
jgi:hypothetical protein